MSRILFFYTIILTLLGFQVCAQVIDLDQEQELIAPDQFEKSTMYYLTPIGAFGYQFGYGNMRTRLSSSLGLNPPRLNDLSAFGIGWRRKVMFYNIHVALPVVSNPSINNSGSIKTIADLRVIYGEFTVGKAIISNDRFFLILKGGLGFIGSEIQIRQYSTDSFDLDNFGTAQGIAWPALDHISGTFDIAIEYTPRALRQLTVMESVQIGYKGGIGSPNWSSSDANLSNTISDRVSMLYLRTSVVISRQR